MSKISWSHKEDAGKNRASWVLPVAILTKHDIKKYSVFLLFSRFQKGPRSTSLKNIMWQQICLPTGTKEKEKMHWRLGLTDRILVCYGFA